jgi:hypothetical protein
MLVERKKKKEQKDVPRSTKESGGAMVVPTPLREYEKA